MRRENNGHFLFREITAVRRGKTPPHHRARAWPGTHVRRRVCARKYFGFKDYQAHISCDTFDLSQSRLESVATETGFLSVVFVKSNDRDMVDFMIQFVVSTESVVGSSIALASTGFTLIAMKQEVNPQKLLPTPCGLPVFAVLLSSGPFSLRRRIFRTARPFKSGHSTGRIP